MNAGREGGVGVSRSGREDEGVEEYSEAEGKKGEGVGDKVGEQEREEWKE